MRKYINSLILIILLSLIALFLKKKINPDEIELESSEPPELKVVSNDETTTDDEINEKDME